ncbi:deoxyribodipyrimidine photo-lyase [Kiritimatiellaeota bacterium B1221]|nr:deoxyribodipyrimidine photo-lyase [Kiritimatiellaeota bacterium B1221]
MDTPPILVWFRNDLRLHDHPAFRAAADDGAPVIPVYLHCRESEGTWKRGAASNWWLHHALQDLSKQLSKKGSRLILRSGKNPEELLKNLIKETGATQIFWNRRFEPAGIQVDRRIKKNLPVTSFPGDMLWEPHKVQTKNGGPYKVFSPFYRALQKLGAPAEPLPEPREWAAPSAFPPSENIDEWKLLPDIPWDSDFLSHWDPTCKGAKKQMELFLDEQVEDYKAERDFPEKAGTSKLSPYLHFGQITSRTVWYEAGADSKGTEAYTRQLVWRDFAKQLLFHFPHTSDSPLQEKYADFPWLKDADALKKWQQGQTGYPLIDAGMRELWATGWMHNRVRMIVASFLVKDLLISWQEGAAWFWDTLVDADLANNSMGWQWAGGCGADAAPYFRVFNPILQSKKFDSSGAYIRRWVPELRDLSDKEIHEPWNAATPPPGYPAPMVDHTDARDRALDALASIKSELPS